MKNENKFHEFNNSICRIYVKLFTFYISIPRKKIYDRLLQYHFNMFRFVGTDENCFFSVSSIPIKSPSPILSPTSSPPPANETFQRNQVFSLFSSSTVKTMNFKDGTSESISGSGSCGTFIGTNKFKPKVNTIVVSPSDNF